MLIGIIGKANTGKSTFFKACTLAEVEIENRPFVTIKANEGVAYVKVDCVEKEFNVKCNPRFGFCIDSKRFVPVKLIDVPGLIPEAHLGKGLGNKFLDDLRQADVFIHIIDIAGTTNEKGEPVKPLTYDPCNDVKFLEHELDMWYFQIIKKGWDKFTRTIQQENQNVKQALAVQLSALKVTEEIIEGAIKKLKLIHKPIEWRDEDLKNLAVELRKKTKPMIIAANKIDVNGAKLNLDRLKEKFPEYLIIPCSAESELALREAVKHNLINYIPGEKDFKIIGNLNEKQKTALEFIKKNVLDVYNGTGIQDVLDKAVFEFLKYITVYPVENENRLIDKDNRILPDAYLLLSESTTLDLAFKIHTDIGNKFIAAIDVKTKRRLGKDYKLKNNDVIKVLTR